MKRAITALTLCVCFIFTFGVTAAAEVVEYYVDSDNLTISIYADDIDESVSCRVSGNECETVYEGDVYNDSECYKTLFLVDSSVSMSVYENLVYDYLTELIDRKGDNEYFAIAQFGTGKSPDYIIDFTSNQYDLEKAADKLTYEYKASYIFDNLNSAVEEISGDGSDCFKRIVLFTDGCENSAAGISIEVLKNTVSDNKIQISTVTVIDANKSNVEELKTVAVLSSISNGVDIRTSMSSYSRDDVTVLIDSVKSVSEMTLTIPGSLADGSVRTVEITTDSGSIYFDMRMPMSKLDLNSIEIKITDMDAEAIADENASFVLSGEGLDGASVNVGDTSFTVNGASTGEIVGNNITVKNLKDGTYIFEETAAPNGYKKAEGFAFTIENGRITGEAFDNVEYSENLIVIKNDKEHTAVSRDLIKMIVIIAGVIIAAAAAVVIILAAAKKRRVSKDRQVIPAENIENDDNTIMISPEAYRDLNGNTEYMFWEEDKRMPIIILRDLTNADRTFEARIDGEVIIGRSAQESTLVIDYDRSISKRHCRIYMKDGDCFIEDLRSSNKSYLNGVEVTKPCIIKTADEIKLGRIIFNITIRK